MFSQTFRVLSLVFWGTVDRTSLVTSRTLAPSAIKLPSELGGSPNCLFQFAQPRPQTTLGYAYQAVIYELLIDGAFGENSSKSPLAPQALLGTGTYSRNIAELHFN